MKEFHEKMLLTIAGAINNFYPDNLDREIRKLSMRHWLRLQFEIWANRLLRRFGKSTVVTLSNGNNYYSSHIGQFAQTYDSLCDEASREKYIELLAYRMLGFSKVKLKLNNDDFWTARSKVDLLKRPGKIPVDFRGGYLEFYDLSDAGYDVKLYFVRNGIFVDFILQQYNYRNLVCVNNGDVVIDAGGCWGDTALYFAAKGAAQVWVYEFIPSNIEILNKNLALNPRYKDSINLVDKAVWETSSIGLSFADRGPSSQVAAQGVYDGATQTLSIDDLVKEKKLERVDFIKMDIEGAEMPALRGAAETIRRFKPKLAISAYHREDDLIAIPAYIRSLNPDYQFYLDYYTIFGDEIVVYAI